MNAFTPHRALMFLSAATLLATVGYGCSDDEGETTANNGSTGVGIVSSSPAAGSGGAGVGGNGNGGDGPCFEAGGGYGGFGDVCMGEASDGACLACTRSDCCPEATECTTEDNCRCLLQCFLDNCDPISCLQLCGQSDQVNALVQCASANCGNQCAGS